MLALSLLLFSLGGLLLWMAFSTALSGVLSMPGRREPEPFDRLDLVEEAMIDPEHQPWIDLSDLEDSFRDRSPRRRSTHHHAV